MPKRPPKRPLTPESTILGELNRALWALDPLYGGREGLDSFWAAIHVYLRNFNMAEMGRIAGWGKDTMRNVALQRPNCRFLTMVRFISVMGLRFRLERDPIPHKAAYGSYHARYKRKVDENGAWDLGE